jgi:MinD-like ATPase involved in chromosome partitioning or flagellar assembly
VNVSIITCGGGAPWEATLVRGLQRRELGVDVLRRCVDHGELIGVALRDCPRAVVLAAELPWLDRELVGTLHEAGVAVVAVESVPGLRPLERMGIAFRTSASATADEIASLLYRLSGTDDPVLDMMEVATPVESGDSIQRATAGPGGELVAVWGGPGAPGRTTVAVHIAIERARAGGRVLLVDGDAWAPSVAQLLGLRESPAITNAARLATDGWPRDLETCMQAGPRELAVIAGFARTDLWPEVGERAWLAVLDACRAIADVVIVDLAAPIEEDEELAFDRAPYRRNAMTRVALGEADCVLQVVGGDPIGLRRGIFAHRELSRELPSTTRSHVVVVNRVPSSPRRLQDMSIELERWTAAIPVALLPVEPAFERVVWEGRPLQDVARRSPWLRELRAVPFVAGGMAVHS